MTVTDSQAARYLEQLLRGPDDPRHGCTGYRYGCRCDTCKTKKAEYMSEYKRRKKVSE